MEEKKLKAYRSKRTFKSPEPEIGQKQKLSQESKKTLKSPIFVIQKHDASHLHYDFRLEIGDVLVSWAIPKTPPIEFGEKRLAIPTEDHPLGYANFEGTIPEGEYGAGTVEIWDHGTYENIKHKNGDIVPISTCLKNGQLEISLNGEKMKGAYALIRTTLGGKEQWLILKMKAR
jgi:bifunctional non-homologous end joining protein LigD